jgi:hypothetical protein
MSNTPHTDKELVFRDNLATMLNRMPYQRGWDGLIEFAQRFHIDLEDESMFEIQLNERIMHAAQELKSEGAAWPTDFEKLASLIASKIPEL